MKIETVRFGSLEAPEERIVSFPEGLPGFEGRRFVILAEKENPLIEWLQSVDEPDVALMMVDPAELLLDYQVTPKPAEVRAVLPDGDDTRLLVRVVMRNGERAGELFLNLFAPILINEARRLAMQIPLVGSGYSVREVWPPQPKSAKVGEPEAE